MYKNRWSNVDRIARERAEEIKIAKEEILAKVEAQKIVEGELKNLKSDYENMLLKYNDKQNELNEFATSNKDQINRILDLEAQNKEVIIAHKVKIGKMEAENKKAVELVEKASEKSKENEKRLWREVMSVRKEIANMKKTNTEAEADINKLRNELDTKDKKLNKVLKQVDRATDMEVEIDQGVDTGKEMKQTRKTPEDKT